MNPSSSAIGLKRDLERCTRSNKHEAAAAWSILADRESVLDRLVATAEILADGEKDPRDQRSARAWSDRGMPGVARDLVEFAEIRGNLGQDLIGITVLGNESDGLTVHLVRVASLELKHRTPHVTMSRSHHGGGSTETELVIAAMNPELTVSDQTHSTCTYIFGLDTDAVAFDEDEIAIGLNIMARSSLSPTFFFRDESNFSPAGRIEAVVFRSRLTIELRSP